MRPSRALLLRAALLVTALSVTAAVQAPKVQDPKDGPRFWTSRASQLELPLPDEDAAFHFAIFGDRTGGPAAGIRILEQAVDEVDLVAPDLVMTVGDLVNGYNEAPEWLEQMREFTGVMGRLDCPWFPVAGNHDVYWRGPEGVAPPPGEHEGLYEEHFGPLWYAFRHKGSVFVVLYTDEGDPQTGEKNFRKPSAQHMSAEQLAWLGTTLERSADAEHVFVFLHHPRWLSERYGNTWEPVHDALAAAGNVRAVFAGHIHQMRYDGERDGIEYFALATVGGGQSGLVPAAGYLHQYHLVTVRPDHIAVAAFPVGSSFDPRAITGEISDQATSLAEEFDPEWIGAFELQSDGSASGSVGVAIANPVLRAIEVTAIAECDDPRWSLTPEHSHVRIEPGETLELGWHAQRVASTMDRAFALPRVRLQVEYLAQGWRVPLPERMLEVPVSVRAASWPTDEPGDSVLTLDGREQLFVAHADFTLPSGPFTLEGWFRAARFAGRQGFVAKTEGSEYGLFVGEGRPRFVVHLDGDYARVEAASTTLETGRWHHLAGVFDGAELRLYQDGQLIARAPGEGARTTNELPLVIGGDVDGAGNSGAPFYGDIDTVRLSQVARYRGERFEPARALATDEDTVLLYDMERRLGPWVRDASESGAHALRR